MRPRVGNIRPGVSQETATFCQLYQPSVGYKVAPGTSWSRKRNRWSHPSSQTHTSGQVAAPNFSESGHYRSRFPTRGSARLQHKYSPACRFLHPTPAVRQGHCQWECICRLAFRSETVSSSSQKPVGNCYLSWWRSKTRHGKYLFRPPFTASRRQVRHWTAFTSF